jgi:dTDP-4-amino-4,6-dideoxygalactose transaminase
MNARLDTVQAAVLIEKLKIFAEELAAREHVARRYNDLLGDLLAVPNLGEGLSSAWAQYTLRLGSHDRNEFVSALKTAGVPTAIYYPKPLHQQTAYRVYPVATKKLAVSEQLAGQVVSLPMHPYLDEQTQDRIVAAVRGQVGNRRSAA